MGRTRRYVPQVVVTLSIVAIVVPLVVVFSVHAPTPLPQMSIGTILRVTARSYMFPALAVLCATALASCAVFTCYMWLGSRLRHIVVALCVMPFLVPSVSLGMAIEEFTPYLSLPITCVMSAFSVSVITQMVAIRYIDAFVLSTLRDLGAKSSLIWRKVIFPVWSRGAVAGALWAMITLVSDPSLYEVFGGTKSFLASHTLRASIGGASMEQLFPVLCAYLIPGLLVTLLIVQRLSKSEWKSPRYMDGAILHNVVRGLFVHTVVRLVAVVITVFCLATIVLTFGIIICGAASGLRVESSFDFSSLLPTTALIALVLPISSFGALVWATAIHRAHRIWRHIGWGTVILCMFLSPVVGGVVLALGARAIRGDQIFLSGYAVLALAGISVCLPLSTLLLVVMRSFQHGAQVEIARDLGARTLRIALQVEGPTIYPMVLAVLCIQVTMILTSVAPFVFIETTEVTTMPVHIASLAAAHLSSQVFLITCVGAAITGVAIVVVVVLSRSMVGTTQQRGHV